MHCFRLCDSVMLHKSNLQSYRRPSLRGFDCQFRHAFCFSYSICTRSVWMTSIQQDDRKEVTGEGGSNHCCITVNCCINSNATLEFGL